MDAFWYGHLLTSYFLLTGGCLLPGAYWMSCRPSGPTGQVAGLLDKLQAFWGLLDELQAFQGLLDKLQTFQGLLDELQAHWMSCRLLGPTG